MSDPAFQNVPQADATWKIEEHDRVRTREAEVQRRGEIPIDDPTFSGDQFLNARPPLLGGRGDPAGGKVVRVEVNDGQIRELAEPPREGGFACAAAAENEKRAPWSRG